MAGGCSGNGCEQVPGGRRHGGGHKKGLCSHVQVFPRERSPDLAQVGNEITITNIRNALIQVHSVIHQLCENNDGNNYHTKWKCTVLLWSLHQTLCPAYPGSPEGPATGDFLRVLKRITPATNFGSILFLVQHFKCIFYRNKKAK